MKASESNTPNWPAHLKGAFWLALILFALAGLLVVRDLPVWMIAIVVVAGLALAATQGAAVLEAERRASIRRLCAAPAAPLEDAPSRRGPRSHG